MPKQEFVISDAAYPEDRLAIATLDAGNLCIYSYFNNDQAGYTILYRSDEAKLRQLLNRREMERNA